jgi:tetratricopeptide (TPR) repeat protein
MSYVFISYMREDKDQIERLCKKLRSYGAEVWLDREQILPGKRWRTAIREAIEKGAFFIACFSEAYKKRDRTYMNEEITFAIDELRRRSPDSSWFIPVLLSYCEIPDRGIGAGETLHDLQWVSLFENWDDGVEKIRKVIEGALDVKVKRAESLYSKGRFDEALKVVEGREFDEHIGALQIRDEVYKQRGDNYASIEALKKILAIANDDDHFLTHLMHMKLGNRYFSTGQFESAVIHFQRAEEILPGHPTVKEGLQAARKKLSGGGDALTRS